MAAPSTTVELDLPAGASSLPVARAVVALLGAMAGLTLDEIDDCEIAVEETGALALAAGAERLAVSAIAGGAGLIVTVGPFPDGSAAPPDDDPTSRLAWRILLGVIDAAEVVADPFPGIRFTKTASPR